MLKERLLAQDNIKWHLAICAMAGLLLAACSPDNSEADLQHCIAQAPSKTGPTNLKGEEAHDAIGAEAADCMKALGYRHDMASPKCVDDVDFNRFCYVRRRSG